MNLFSIYGIQERKKNNGIIVADICANMNDDAKISYVLDSGITVSCKLKNTPREILKYPVFYIETYFDILYVYIKKEKEKKS